MLILVESIKFMHVLQQKSAEAHTAPLSNDSDSAVHLWSRTSMQNRSTLGNNYFNKFLDILKLY